MGELLILPFHTILVNKVYIAAAMHVGNSIVYHLESLGMAEAIHSVLQRDT